ncbi:hypothetical protein [Paenibacillus tyrfis]|uniref:hypothetical protein n=1 Tax=Paenibacillus tyrfis TaxID=1501230 RepID=UPI000B589333|nr:hypothetical protein [Paenibacillus tyrfis]
MKIKLKVLDKWDVNDGKKVIMRSESNEEVVITIDHETAAQFAIGQSYIVDFYTADEAAEGNTATIPDSNVAAATDNGTINAADSGMTNETKEASVNDAATSQTM